MSKETSIDRVRTGKSWDEFCDALKAAGKVVLSEAAPDDMLNRSEGFRYLSRLTRAGLEAFIEYADPLAPELHRPIHETVKIGADNPDNYYQNAQISGAYEYRIVGLRNTIHYLDFATQTAGVASTGDSQQSGHVDAADLEIADDGSFELLLSCEQKPGNWLPMVPETTQLIVRQTYLDRTSETPAELRIERIGGERRPSPLSPELLDKGLASAVGLVAGCSNLFAGWAKGFQAHTNELPRFDDSVSMGAGGDPNICYYHSYWQLGLEEALVIEVTPPDCHSWNFQLDNHWMESLDYRYHRIAVNHHGACLRDDGSVRLILAHRDPEVDNWLDTAHHCRGTMCLRWIGADEHPEPTTQVVNFSKL